MGTRADFYVGRGKSAEWIGSIAFDGYPDEPGVDKAVWSATSESAYRAAVADELARQTDTSTHPKQGWPWPWDTSATTDYAYAFDDGKVWASVFGNNWFEVAVRRWDANDGWVVSKTKAVFPSMSRRRRRYSRA